METTTTTTGLTPEAEAVLAATVLAVRSDRNLTNAELGRLRTMVYLSPLFAGVENVDEAIRDVWRSPDWREEGVALARIAGALSEPLRETAYAWAAEMTYADGVVVEEEHAFLSRLREALGVHGVLAGKIKATLAILNRKAD